MNEFLALTQGTCTVLQYAQICNHVCQYAGYHADSDAKKWDCFRRGLNTKLREHLNLVHPDSFNELVNLAITQDDCIAAHRAEKKRKAPTGPSGAQSPRYHLVQNTVPRAPQRNSPSGRLVLRPPQQQGAVRPPMPQQQQSGPRPNNQQQQFGPGPNNQQFNRANGNNRCFTCESFDHFSRACPRNQKPAKGQIRSRTTRTRARSRSCKCDKEKLTLLLLQSFQRAHQL